ncbi:TPA: hypothetical protein ACGOX1_001175, partial [Streptococcus suis]
MNLEFFKNNIKFSQREIEKMLNQPKGFLTIIDNNEKQKFMFYIFPVPEDGEIDFNRRYISL